MRKKVPERLIRLFHHRWSVPVLAELSRTDGSKFITLVNRLGISRDSLAHTLIAITEAGWVMKNPGYGHPLRPEYILTEAGRQIASICADLRPELGSAEEIGLNKWSMPVLMAVENARFSDIKAAIPDITSRALTQALKDLQSAGLLVRQVSEGYPPTPQYTLSPRGRALLPILESLEAATREG
jgi:DNA-binding HxlR family transcriptional regulator